MGLSGKRGDELRREKLKRELRMEALARLEEAARTEDSFNEIVEIWDKLDKNKVRRWDNHEIVGFTDEEWKKFKGADGDFLDIIFDSPEEMHQLIEDGDISRMVKSLSRKQKDVLYLNAVRLYEIWQIALVKGQSERNIRKLRTLMFHNIRSELFPVLQKRIENKIPITTSARKFLSRYDPMNEIFVDTGDDK